MSVAGAHPRVLVLGGLGMLGHKLCQVLASEMDVWATVRRDSDMLRDTGFIKGDRILEGVDARNPATVNAALDAASPDVVVNCIGIVKQLPEAEDPELSIRINALFPHQLAKACTKRGSHLIHISTDCVFSGRLGMYQEEDATDASDLYGRTKAMGEIVGAGCLTLRTSIIGRELRGQHGLVEWLLAQRGKTVQGYTNAIFSGLTTFSLCRVIGKLIEQELKLDGLYHVASCPISKYDLLHLAKDAYSLPIRIEPCGDVMVNRSLDGSRFRANTGLIVAEWPDMVQELAQDPFDYEDWRRTHAA